MKKPVLYCAFAASFLLQACTLPGYDLDDQGANSPWYGKGGDPREMPENGNGDLQPTVHEITPKLVASQSRQQPPAAESERPRRSPQPGNDFKDYHVGPGDVLNVVVFNHPSLTNPAGTTQSLESAGRLVNAEGEIFFPFIGDLKVAGLTLREIRDRIAKGLSRVIRDPQVDVRVAQFRSQKVFITGDITKPCSVPITDVPLTVLDALDSCDTLAGKEGPVGVTNLKLVRDGQVFPLDLNEIYRSGTPLHLQDGDRLIVDDSASRVFIVGEFEDQVAAPYSAGGITLADAIAAGGGINLETGDPGAIYVIRGYLKRELADDGHVQTTLRPEIFHLNASSVDALILADQFKLQPRDVVYAAPASMVSLNRAIAQITPSLDLLFKNYLIYDRLDRGN